MARPHHQFQALPAVRRLPAVCVLILTAIAAGNLAAQTPGESVAKFPQTGTYPTDKLGAIRVWGLEGEPQSAEKPYSIAVLGDVLRLEARQGDRRQKPSEVKREIERSEVSFPANPFEFGTTYRLVFDVLFEGGEPALARNDKFVQIHAVKDRGDVDLGPAFALQLERDRMRAVVRWDANAQSTGRPADHWVFEDTAKIERDHWYAFVVTIRFDPFGKGMVAVKRDGVQIVEYAGPLGYNDQQPPYFKVGIYRDSQPDTQARRYRRMTLTKQ
jgi:hypothetical protein